MKISLVVYVYVEKYCSGLAQRIKEVIGKDKTCKGLELLLTVRPCDPGDATWVQTSLIWQGLGPVECPESLKSRIDTLVWNAIVELQDRKAA